MHRHERVKINFNKKLLRKCRQKTRVLKIIHKNKKNLNDVSFLFKKNEKKKLQIFLYSYNIKNNLQHPYNLKYIFKLPLLHIYFY